MINAAPTDLTGKTCLITGAFGGIGASVVEHFSALGATVYATDISETYSGDAIYRQFDLIDELSDACDWVKKIKPDVLFNNAAISDMGSILDADLEQYDRLFGLNVRAFYAVMQATAKSMVINENPGSIINVASWLCQRALKHTCTN